MIKKDSYFISITPFKVVEKNSDKLTILSNKGKYYKLKSSCIPELNIGDCFYRKVFLGEGIFQVNYLKADEIKKKEQHFNNILEEILFKFGDK